MQFWELDQDHDFMIDRDDLLRYGQHGLTYRIVDRIFQQAPRRFACQTPGKMGYEDFVYFILSEEDKTTDASLKYWHRCADLDDDGIVTAEDMRCGPASSSVLAAVVGVLCMQLHMCVLRCSVCVCECVCATRLGSCASPDIRTVPVLQGI